MFKASDDDAPGMILDEPAEVKLGGGRCWSLKFEMLQIFPMSQALILGQER